jgi:6-phosphogluconolactonase
MDFTLWRKSRMTVKHDIHIFEDEAALAAAFAQRFVEGAKAAADRFTVALTGGSTPVPAYRLLATDAYASQVNWDKVHIYFGDDRAVPPNHPDSNYGAAHEALLAHVPIPLENVHRMKGELGAEEGAKDYGLMLKAQFGDAPDFDLHLLGMGDDGHTASLFPHITDALYESKHRAIATEDDLHPHPRITMTAWAINAAKSVLVMVDGTHKADLMHDVIHGQHQPEVYPIQLIEPANGVLTWYLDRAAASKLPEAKR